MYGVETSEEEGVGFIFLSVDGHRDRLALIDGCEVDQIILWLGWLVAQNTGLLVR